MWHYCSEKIKQAASVWYQSNRELVLSDEGRKQRQAEYQQINKDRISVMNKIWRLNNRSHVNRQSNKYQKHHRPYYTAKQAAYRAQKRLATPGWCEYDAIILLYQESRKLSHDTGILHHVDHIVPLVHPKVCGLHCLSNLRIITEHDNKTKSNKFDIE